MFKLQDIGNGKRIKFFLLKPSKRNLLQNLQGLTNIEKFAPIDVLFCFNSPASIKGKSKKYVFV